MDDPPAGIQFVQDFSLKLTALCCSTTALDSESYSRPSLLMVAHQLANASEVILRRTEFIPFFRSVGSV